MNWMLKDSRGNPSSVLTMTVAGVVTVIGKYIVAGHTLPLIGAAPPMSATEFATAFGVVVGVWVAHENNKRKVGS
jgi:hypothetical protein